jgi:hypothetical protein
VAVGVVSPADPPLFPVVCTASLCPVQVLCPRRAPASHPTLLQSSAARPTPWLRTCRTQFPERLASSKFPWRNAGLVDTEPMDAIIVGA